MAKSRRTKKEKVKASMRQSSPISSPQEVSSSSFSYAIPTLKKTTTAQATTTDIASDLRKTLFITGTIIVAQIILFVLLQNR